MLENERAEGAEPAFRTALVADSPMIEPAARLFKALYDLRGHPGVEVEVFASRDEALGWLGVSPDLPETSFAL